MQTCNTNVYGVLVVKFDLQQGQVIETMVSDNIFDEFQLKKLALYSFPDSNTVSDFQGIMQYTFRLQILTSFQKQHKTLYGYTCFIQKKQKSNPRGYLQKTIIVLSQYTNIKKYIAKSYAIASLIIKGAQYKKQLQNVYQDRQNKSNHQFHLTIQQALAIQTDQNYYFRQAKIFDAFNFDTIAYLWPIWEALILNKSFIIYGDNPHIASNAILSAVSLISPLKYTGKCKPYFTIYQQNFKQIQQLIQSNQLKNTVLGITNPVFLKLFSNYQGLINLSKPNKLNDSWKKRIKVDKQVMKQLIRKEDQQSKVINGSLIRKYFKRLTVQFLSLFSKFLQLQKFEKTFDYKLFQQFVNKQQKVCVYCDNQRWKGLYKQFCKSSNCINLIMQSQNVIKIKGK